MTFLNAFRLKLWSKDDQPPENIHPSASGSTLENEKENSFLSGLNEMNLYLTMKNENPNCDIFAWWRQNQDKFPILLKLFKRFNSAPPGSHEVERLFSRAGYIDNDRRNLLLPETLEKLLFLNVNLVLYNFNYAL